jgi:hypothetical protein
MIRETCSCGATFSSDRPYAGSDAATWRRDHRCLDPVTLVTEETDSGPGLADVIHAIECGTLATERLSDLVLAYIKAQS